jgi:CRISPR-associated protein Csm5
MKYRVSIETLSPLHIGSGVELLANYDYKALPEGNLTYVFDQDAIYARELAERGEKADLAQPAASLIKDLAHLPAEFVRYTLKGCASLERLHEQMKDVYGGVYLPGSSLKGALRTALMTYAVSRKELSAKALGDNPKEAAKNWEKDIFGDSPWSDILRTLQIADSRPVNPPPLEVLQVRVFVSQEDKEAIPIEIEAVSAGTNFETQIHLDELALQYANDARLKWTQERLALLANLLPILQAVGKRRIESEGERARRLGFDEVARFYDDLTRRLEGAEGQASAFVQIGWGTGWEGMTVGEALDQPTVDYLRQKYDLGKPPAWNETEKGAWQPDLSKSFPKGRRFSGAKIPHLPLGWVKLTMTPVGAPRLGQVWSRMQGLANAGVEPMREFASVSDVDAVEGKKRTPPAAPSVPSGVIWLFDEEHLPKPGDSFDGVVISADSRNVILSFPGLNPDDYYGILSVAEYPALAQVEERRSIRAKVLEVKSEAGLFEVRCQVIRILPKRG